MGTGPSRSAFDHSEILSCQDASSSLLRKERSCRCPAAAPPPLPRAPVAFLNLLISLSPPPPLRPSTASPRPPGEEEALYYNRRLILSVPCLCPPVPLCHQVKKKQQADRLMAFDNKIIECKWASNKKRTNKLNDTHAGCKGTRVPIPSASRTCRFSDFVSRSTRTPPIGWWGVRARSGRNVLETQLMIYYYPTDYRPRFRIESGQG